MQRKSGLCDCRFRASERLEEKLESLFQAWLRILIKFPWLMMLVAFVLCAAFTAGFALINVENQPEKVWVPVNSDAFNDRDDVEDLFGDRIQRYIVYATSDNDDIKDLMSVQPPLSEPFQELVNFDTIFKSFSEDNIDYYKICERLSTSNPCVLNEYALGFWEDVSHNINFDAETPYQVHYRIQTGRGVSPLYEDFDPNYIPTTRIFSGRLPENMNLEADGSNDIYYFEAIQYEYTIQVDSDDEDDVEDWKDEVDNIVEDFNDANNIINVHVFSLDRVASGLIEALNIDAGLYLGCILFIFVYGMFVIGRCHPLYCRVPLSLAMIVAYIMTLAMGWGFTCYVYEFVAGNLALSFLLALETLLYSSFLVRSTETIEIRVTYTQPDESSSAHDQKFIKVFSRAAVSLLKTTSIGLLSFGIGSYSPFIAIRSFCAAGACMTVFNFFNCLTFFGACLYYDFKRIMADKKDCCGLCTCDAEGAFFCCGKCVLDEFSSKKQPYLEAILIKRVVPVLTRGVTKIILLVFYMIILGLGIAGAILIKHEFEVDWLVTDDDSQVADAIDVRDDYFGQRGWMVGFYVQDVDFSFKSTQKDLLSLADAMRTCPDCHRDWIFKETVFSWYESFKEWVGQDLCVDSVTLTTYFLDTDGTVPPAHFDYCLEAWLKTPLGSMFINDLAFENGVLKMARIIGRIEYIEDQRDAVRAKRDLNDIADDYGPGDTFPYNENFLFYEQFEQLYPHTWIFIAIVVILTGLVNFALTVRVSSSLLVLLNTIAIILSMFFTMWVLSAEFNVISVLHIYMCAIIASEFSTHITHAFISTPGNRTQRLESAFKFIGATLPHICLAGFLSIIIFLVPAQTYIFQVWAKMWGGTLFFIFTHCFLALPAFLESVGPASLGESFDGKIRTDKDEKDDIPPWQDEMRNDEAFAPPAVAPVAPAPAGEVDTKQEVEMQRYPEHDEHDGHPEAQQSSQDNLNSNIQMVQVNMQIQSGLITFNLLQVSSSRAKSVSSEFSRSIFSCAISSCIFATISLTILSIASSVSLRLSDSYQTIRCRFSKVAGTSLCKSLCNLSLFQLYDSKPLYILGTSRQVISQRFSNPSVRIFDSIYVSRVIDEALYSNICYNLKSDSFLSQVIDIKDYSKYSLIQSCYAYFEFEWLIHPCFSSSIVDYKFLIQSLTFYSLKLLDSLASQNSSSSYQTFLSISSIRLALSVSRVDYIPLSLSESR